jgi:hypothetical protein
MCNHAGDGRAARMVRAQDLTEKEPERGERSIDPILPYTVNRCQSLRDKVLRQNIAEGKAIVLEKLVPEEIELLPKPSLVTITHHSGLLAGDGTVQRTIYASEAFLPMSFCVKHFLHFYVPFVSHAAEVFD